MLSQITKNRIEVVGMTASDIGVEGNHCASGCPANPENKGNTKFRLSGLLKKSDMHRELRWVLRPATAGRVTRRSHNLLRACHNHDFVAVKTCPNILSLSRAIKHPITLSQQSLSPE
jgi:hypothetical protein